METSAAQYIAMSEGIDSLNPIEKEIATQSMLQNAALSTVYSSVGTLTEKTEQELIKNKTAIDTVKTSVETLGSADIKPGVTSITKGAGTNTQSIVKAISGMEISIKNAVTGGGGSGGSGGASSGKTGASSGSNAGLD
jgi:hypothetical protein